ncbi:hypothetical protein J010_04728 [Cryptococcus neoformans]|uniref:Uncharacterized protein n=1 Tax=Cryptococcus neoformans Tu259-1 TaxID=1230072 RepID=A0A854Q806_CRYNE|nr:hypothetical protein C368_05000 [Cryptococcus neoformans var. grubii 125.91]OXG16771.1 hypothetical protein C361_05142 [Cryptococcus neoformans var. grubii Tu259-1]OXG47542.1 hypothetical protein C355_04853 [Cryptococcus neoformans var. grubii Th84]OXG81834.1 hypothetical protein C346_04766 [Cryptococcus neoformans var. grubii D17-1]OXG94398.1 hypothetical protein C345_04653 [Cryptococcus neoformans var. grubii A2-102-5]OXH05894.1 hypothetical protein J010_04728 [Cryptococcus neoformans var
MPPPFVPQSIRRAPTQIRTLGSSPRPRPRLVLRPVPRQEQRESGIPSAESSAAAQRREDITRMAVEKVEGIYRREQVYKASAKGKERARPENPSSFPPIISRLLSARLYRLATLHLLDTPSLAADEKLVTAMRDHMFLNGADSLGRRLDRGLERWKREKGDVIKFLPDLKRSKKEVGEGKKLAPECPYPPLPLTNTFLSNLLRKPYTPPTHTHLTLPLPFPPPSPNLLQVEHLLNLINHLEQEEGFQADRETAVLILACWLRCVCTKVRNPLKALPEIEHPSDPVNTSNPTHPSISPPSYAQSDSIRDSDSFSDADPKPFLPPPTPHQILTLFQTLHPHLTPSSHILLEATREEREWEWDKVVRPFGKAFINSLRAVGSAPSDSVTVSVWKGAGSFGTRSHGIHGSSKRGWDRGVKEIGVVKRWMKMRKKELLGDDSMI